MKTTRKLLTTAVALLMLTAVAVPLHAQQTTRTTDQQQSEAITPEKVVEMTRADLSSETIINAIISSGSVFNLSASQVVSLKEQGVDEDVINFMLRTQPVETEPSSQGETRTEPAEPAQPQQPRGDTGAYYDGHSYVDDEPYQYTDGYGADYGYDYGRGYNHASISYHYYGPWFRAYPYYYGFYYYPVSYYYWSYWPDDYYYYFYYPRFTTWRYYYYYPRYGWNDHYYIYSGGRYSRVKGGRYIDRRIRTSGTTRYAQPRDGSRRTRDGDFIAPATIRGKTTDYRSRSRVTRGSVTRGSGSSYRSRSAVPRNPVARQPSTSRSRSSVTRSTTGHRSRSSARRSSSSRSRYSAPSGRSSRSKASSSRSSRSSRSKASSSRSSRSSRSKASSSRSSRSSKSTPSRSSRRKK